MAELIKVAQNDVRCAKPALRCIVGRRFVDRVAVDLDHAVVVALDFDSQHDGLLRAFGEHLVAYTVERIAHDPPMRPNLARLDNR